MHSSDSGTLLAQCEQQMIMLLQDNEPCIFHLASGGNRTRAKLCIETGLTLRLPVCDVLAVAGAVELLHNASLIHDDLQDKDTTRRGRSSVWKKFGADHALCAGDAMISAAYASLGLAKSSLLGVLLMRMHHAVSTTVKGQSLDIDSQHNLSHREYEAIAGMKSGPLISLCLELPLLLANYPQATAAGAAALHKFSIAYQIIDDIDDWEQDAQHKQLNLVNLLSSHHGGSKAQKIAIKRVHELLRQCQQALLPLPHGSGEPFIKAAEALLASAHGAHHKQGRILATDNCPADHLHQ